MKKTQKDNSKGRIKAYLNRHNIPHLHVTDRNGKRVWLVKGEEFDSLEKANQKFKFVEL
jgi:hypothetical protein